MTSLALLLGLAALAAILALSSQARSFRRRQDLLEARLRGQELRIEALERGSGSGPIPGNPAVGETLAPTHRDAPATASPEPYPLPTPMPPVLATARNWEDPAIPAPVFSAPAPVEPTATSEPRTAPSIEVPDRAVVWEQFMGVRLFAWLGGLALFLGVAYFVKYSFERNLIPPSGRVAMGLLTGAGLLAGGRALRRREYAVTSQTLCATGVVVLYAALFAGHQLYHLAWLPTGVTFAAMSAVTAVAFGLAARTRALVVAILGMLGGFLTPVLLSEGGDQPVALFSYLALLDAGLIAVALRCRWPFLPALGALCTASLQCLWASRDFDVQSGLLGLGIFAGFIALFAAGLGIAQRLENAAKDGDWLGAALGVSSATALGLAGWMLGQDAWVARPGMLFLFVLAAELGFLAAAGWRPRLTHVQTGAGFLAFVYLTTWMARARQESLLGWSIGLSLAFALLHVAFPLLLALRRPSEARTAMAGAQVFPPLALLALVVPLLRMETPSFALWPAILLINLLALALAAWSGGLVGALAAMLLSGLGMTIWIGRLPQEATGLGGTLAVLLATAALFATAGAALARWVPVKGWPPGGQGPGSAPAGEAPANLRTQIPVLAVLLPYFSLAQVFGQLRLEDPSMVFAAVAALSALLFALASRLRLGVLPLAGLAGLALVEHAWWWSPGSAPDHPVVAVLWAVGFLAAWATSPFWPGTRLAQLHPAWVAAALAGLPQFHLVYRIVERAWPNEVMGLLPLAFAIPPALTLAWLVRKTPPEAEGRLGRLAWFGGVTLFFITVALPIQFDRQWLTLGFALEGAALLGLFRRVPHPGLRGVGISLLVVVFLRLIADPRLLEDAIRGPYPLWNGWLYTYGLAASAMFAGARLLRPESRRVQGIDARSVLVVLGTVLLFALLNLQIADLFTTPGQTVRFEFGGNLGRDMTYTIAWSLFALGLVVAGLAWHAAASRWAGLGLLSVAIAKLFLNDLARLDQLYRVGALIGVALVALAASVLYQRFVARESHLPGPGPSGH